MRWFSRITVVLFVCWVVSGCQPAAEAPKAPGHPAGPTSDPLGETVSKPTRPAAAPRK